jgi:exodeoxyribonuclease VII small subunit
MTDTPISEMTFEQAMSELERIVTQLEKGDVPLEDSISLYEKGAELKKRCETKVKEAEQKVAAITLDEEGSVTGTKPLEGL